jgi:hypothetical protein
LKTCQKTGYAQYAVLEKTVSNLKININSID